MSGVGWGIKTDYQPPIWASLPDWRGFRGPLGEGAGESETKLQISLGGTPDLLDSLEGFAARGEAILPGILAGVGEDGVSIPLAIGIQSANVEVHPAGDF